jgi:hypothetical protein
MVLASAQHLSLLHQRGLDGEDLELLVRKEEGGKGKGEGKGEGDLEVMSEEVLGEASVVFEDDRVCCSTPSLKASKPILSTKKTSI